MYSAPDLFGDYMALKDIFKIHHEVLVTQFESNQYPRDLPPHLSSGERRTKKWLKATSLASSALLMRQQSTLQKYVLGLNLYLAASSSWRSGIALLLPLLKLQQHAFKPRVQ